MAPIKVSILGVGLSLQVFHYPMIEYLPELYTLHSVYERSGKETAKAIVGDVKIVTTFEEVVEDKEVELVIVSTPNNTHFDFAKRAIEAGKHVMIEKPVCPTAAEVAELNELAIKHHVILGAYQNRRWDSDFMAVQQLIASGRLGKLNEFQSSFDRHRPLPPSYKTSTWKETPGMHNEGIYNLGSHLIDQALVLFGLPDRVGCRTWDMRGVGLDEAFVLDLYYPKEPLVVTLRASMLSTFPADKQSRYLIKGDKGTYAKNGTDAQEGYLRGTGKKVGGPDYGYEDTSLVGQLTESVDGKYVVSDYPSMRGNYPAIYENLHEAITSGDRSKLLVQPEQVIWTAKIIELGLRASKEGKVLSVER
ncbi:hypothetical protein P7C73_g2950, partial [Tremellales sp. Uapishka_1]